MTTCDATLDRPTTELREYGDMTTETATTPETAPPVTLSVDRESASLYANAIAANPMLQKKFELVVRPLHPIDAEWEAIGAGARTLAEIRRHLTKTAVRRG